jgi:serine/threonine protein kinase
MAREEPLPPWWESVSQAVRQVYLKLGPDTLPPSVEVSRIFYTLQATVLQMGDQLLRTGSPGEGMSPDRLQSYESLLKILNEEVLKKWREIDPAPPNSGIAYEEFNTLINDIEAACPGTRGKLEKTLAQPRAQVEIVLDAWDHKEFELARRGLRMLHVWDPERRRLLQADRALVAAPQWLSLVNQGAGADEPFYDYITTVELAGRRLRSQIGPAGWLDTILEAFKALRKGSKHADLIMDHPQVLNEMPWLSEYRSREILSLPRTRPLRLDRHRSTGGATSLISGVVEARLGPGKDVQLVESLDTWIPEARGSSARVFAGNLNNPAAKPSTYAVKVMRPDSIEYATPLFREEARILTLLRDVPGVSPLVECGYLRLKNAGDFPSDEGHSAVNQLRGEVVRFGVEETQNYLASMERYMAQGWLPYLALVKREQEYNLMKYCDAGYTHGWFLPLRESLLLVTQICDILQVAHDRNIVYRDHKILHYYWDPQAQGVVMIDWNIAKRQPQGLSEAERQFDLAQFGARAFHHILTGRPAMGALPLGPNRPEEIEHSALRYPVNWTFDDERLPNRVKEIIEQLLNQGYTNIRDLRRDLAQVFEQIPDPAQPVG